MSAPCLRCGDFAGAAGFPLAGLPLCAACVEVVSRPGRPSVLEPPTVGGRPWSFLLLAGSILAIALGGVAALGTRSARPLGGSLVVAVLGSLYVANAIFRAYRQTIWLGVLQRRRLGPELEEAMRNALGFPPDGGGLRLAVAFAGHESDHLEAGLLAELDDGVAFFGPRSSFVQALGETAGVAPDVSPLRFVHSVCLRRTDGSKVHLAPIGGRLSDNRAALEELASRLEARRVALETAAAGEEPSAPRPLPVSQQPPATGRESAGA